ncbi:dnaJ homolog subfamily B member 12-like [Pocillopora verrucosa]|uniref:dnaJ homolog subfamily B member 12-like n=1 Tax=Pocillopora verrucosa TaxID=203993 RepID=UPI00334184E6
MDGNKDEALKCRRLAENYLKEGNKERAFKFLHKAQKLYPSKEVEDLIESLSKNGMSTGAKHETRDENLRHRAANGSATHSAPEEKNYTPEQVEAVKKIKKCKDYYEILGVNKEATEPELKKAYKKLALQFHPDKNRAPGASEAFKAIGNAFAVLSDPEKRRRYDQYGDENPQPQIYRNHNDYSRGFEADITPEELFNMFFGGFGGISGGRVFMQRRHNHGRRHRPQQFHEEEENEPPLLHSLLQFMPILLLVGLSLMSSFMLQDPPYSLSRTGSYYIRRETPKRKIPFYVQEGFEDQYENKIHMIEKRVEDDYIGRLQSQCYRERQYREEVRARARFWRDQALLNRANDMQMKSCEALEKIPV